MDLTIGHVFGYGLLLIGLTGIAVIGYIARREHLKD